MPEMTMICGGVETVLARPGPGFYEGRFGNWEERSSVRAKPRRRLQEADVEDQPFFPPEFLPVVAHPLVATRGPGTRNRLLVHALYQYLSFTTVLEQTAVLPVTAEISAGRSGLTLPDGMRSDAFKITTDEAWHAQFSHDFLREVTRVTGIRPSAVVEPCFVRHLADVRESFEPSARELVDLFFAVVSETLVSGLLAGIPNDKRLPAPVRALVSDHAEDEGRHHAYFRSFLRFLWPRLSLGERHLIGPRLPTFARIFLQPDEGSVARMLEVSGFNAGEVADIVGDCYPQRRTRQEVESSPRGMVKAFRDVGALDDKVITDAFETAGLLDHANT